MPILLLCWVLLFLIGCDNYSAKVDAEIQRAEIIQSQLASMEEEKRLVDGSYATLFETLAMLNDTLQVIADRNEEIQRLLTIRELTEDEAIHVQIMIKLDLLKNVNQQSKANVNTMRRTVVSYRVENEQLKKMIAKHEVTYLEREKDLDSLHAYIQNLQFAHETLNKNLNFTQSDLANAYIALKKKNMELLGRKEQLEQTLADLQRATSFIEKDAKGYVLDGTIQTLRKDKIISVFSKKTCRDGYSEIVKNKWRSISIYTQGNLGIEQGAIQYILPARDINSYYIDNDTLHITNKMSFWQTSKIVVIVKK